MTRRLVIEKKDDPKYASVQFKIGHNEAESMTFIPDIVQSQQTSSWYADIAGLQDPSGDLTEFVNCFVNKYIFK